MKLELTEGFGCRETRPSGCIEREREKKKSVLGNANSKILQDLNLSFLVSSF